MKRILKEFKLDYNINFIFNNKLKINKKIYKKLQTTKAYLIP